ncbi:MAG: hypothetical protein ACYTEQ_14410 [Planctomycetota bacterium]|jgi:hypothetical protein
MSSQQEKPPKLNLPTPRKGWPPQLTFNWVDMPAAAWNSLKLKKAERFILCMAMNMEQRGINLYRSFTGKEIAYLFGGSSTSVTRAKKSLAERGLITIEGILQWQNLPPLS